MRKFDKDKYLRKLRFKKYKRYLYIGIPCLLVLLIGIYFAYSKFSVSKDTEVVRTTVGEFIFGDIVITPYIDGEYSKEFPKEEPGINVEKVLCDNDAVGKWDEDNWQLKVTNLTKRTKCNVYFVTPKSCGINDNVKCISNREEFATLANEVNNGDNKSGKIYYLTSDIDLGGKFDNSGNALDGNISWTPIGTMEANPFSGIFDGNGHIISNMYVNTTERAALFVFTKYATIKNMGIKDSYIKSTSQQASSLVNRPVNSYLVNLYNSASINGNTSSAGIASEIIDSVLKNCYNVGTVNSNGNQFAAGIVGYVSNSISLVKNCYNLGSIVGGSESGGVVGGLQGRVECSYNLGDISGRNLGGVVGQYYTPSSPQVYNTYNLTKMSNGGGIIGIVYTEYDSNLIKNNYFLEGTATYGLYNASSNTGTGTLSKDKMPSVISVINGDNAFVEDINNINNGYPILKWQANR